MYNSVRALWESVTAEEDAGRGPERPAMGPGLTMAAKLPVENAEELDEGTGPANPSNPPNSPDQPNQPNPNSPDL